MFINRNQKYKLDIAYIGSGFHGWQSQPDKNTIQDYVERGLSLLLKANIKLIAATRTDSGVHARHQIATFTSESKIDQQKLRMSLQALLPKTIGINAIEQTDLDFHPILACKGKAYRYSLWLDRCPNPFYRDFSWRIVSPLDLDKIVEASQYLIGSHDFSSFCAGDSCSKTKVREIYEVQFQYKLPMVHLWVSGNGFLKQMIRIIVGTLIKIGKGKLQPADMLEILAKKNRTAAGQTAPPQGLCLMQIFYDKIVQLDELIAKGDCWLNNC